MAHTKFTHRRALPARILAFSVLSFLMITSAHAAEPAGFEEALSTWQKQRVARLLAEDGWLTLIGLDWLQSGDNSFGSAADNAVIIKGGTMPDHAGILTLDHQRVHVHLPAGSPLTVDGRLQTEADLTDDLAEQATVLRAGSVSMHVIRRGDRVGIRSKDTASPARTHFAGLEWFPGDPQFRVDAVLVPYPPGKKLTIINILGMSEDDPSPGALVFDLQGKTYHVDPVQEDGSQTLFLMIADKTSGKQTYGAGRYIQVQRAAEAGHWTIDFNQAYNPPCAFTTFATCPLPPPGNRLPLFITAGEKAYAGAEARH